LDGSTALWRLELKLNAEGRAAFERDMHEAVSDAEIEDERDHARGDGYYTIEVVETNTSALDSLVFIYGGDEEDKKGLLIERQLFEKSGGLVPKAVEAILRHAGMMSPTHGWARAFNQRFFEELEARDGIVKITGEDIDAWLWEMRRVAQCQGT
jgi:hypothetical protein